MVKVYDSSTGQGIAGVKVAYNFSLEGAEIARTDDNGVVEISGVGNLYDMEVNVFTPRGYATLEAYENCGSQQVYFLKDELLEVPMTRGSAIKINFKRKPSFKVQEKSYFINTVDTHCETNANKGTGVEIYWKGNTPNDFHGDEMQHFLIGAMKASPYAKRVDIYSPAELAEYLHDNDTSVIADTSFYVNPPFDQDTTNVDVWFE